MATHRIGLALGAGGAKGFAHIGVLRALEEAKIPIHAIAGTSMGSLVGAFYATGMSPYFMRGLATSLRWRHWVDFTVPKMGMIAGEKVRELVRMLTRNQNIEDTSLLFAAVATEIVRRERVVFRTGCIADAVRASISIPGVFVPYVIDGNVFVDGGVLDPVPSLLARELGADVVIAVDLGAYKVPHAPESLVDVMMQSIDMMQTFANRDTHEGADIVVAPMVADIGMTQFRKADAAIAAGYEATMRCMPAICQAVFGDGESSVDETGA